MMLTWNRVDEVLIRDFLPMIELISFVMKISPDLIEKFYSNMEQWYYKNPSVEQSHSINNFTEP